MAERKITYGTRSRPRNWNEYILNPLTKIHWRAVVPATAAVLAPIASIKVVAIGQGRRNRRSGTKCPNSGTAAAATAAFIPHPARLDKRRQRAISRNDDASHLRPPASPQARKPPALVEYYPRHFPIICFPRAGEVGASEAKTNGGGKGVIGVESCPWVVGGMRYPVHMS